MNELLQNPAQMGPVAGGTTAQDPTTGGAISGNGPVMDFPLREICATWIEKLKIADTYKEQQFARTARECLAFFDGPYDFLYNRKYATSAGGAGPLADDGADDMPAPSYQMTVNKVAELVQIFGPVLYHRNPNRQVNPRELPQFPIQAFGNPADPMTNFIMAQVQGQQDGMRMADSIRSMLIEWYLNYTPTELDLKTNSRRAIDEALIKGMGLLWTETYQPKGAPFKLVGSFFDSVDHLLVDPDYETVDDAKWIARRCCHPTWQVEQEYGLEPGSLKANLESASRQSEVNASGDGTYDRSRGTTNDLFIYWKIFSKMGVGGRLQGAPPELEQVLGQFGDYCYLVVAESVPYPLNLPPSATSSADPGAAEGLLQLLEWPTPFWLDDAWPFTPLVFHEVPRRVWPQSHLKPALGELKFLNWAYSFLASKIKVTCRDFLAIKKSVSEEIKETILHGRDLTLIEIEEAHGTISEIVQFLNHPEINGDVWKVIEAVTANFEKRTGLTELVYGESQTQMRSAQEADLKGSQLQIRPDDMAQKTEDFMSAVARKEALAIRWHLQPQDLQPLLGPVGAQMWGQYVMGGDPYAMVHQLEYRIEAGSTKKPNRQRDQQNAKDAMQSLFAPLFQYAMTTMNVGPVNALIAFWAKTIDLDAHQFLLAPPPMPPIPGPGGPGGPPGKPPAGGGGPPQGQAA